MTRALTIFCFLLSAFAAVAQPLPPQDNSVNWMLNYWPAPAPVTNVTLTLPVAVEHTLDLGHWTPVGLIPMSFTVPNRYAQEFFRVKVPQQIRIEAVDRTPYAQGLPDYTNFLGMVIYVGPATGPFRKASSPFSIGPKDEVVMYWPRWTDGSGDPLDGNLTEIKL